MIDIAMIVCILYESIAMELAAGGVNQKSDDRLICSWGLSSIWRYNDLL